MTTTLERGLSRASSASMSVSSPRLSVRRDVTPPAVSDPALLHIHDRINQLDSRILDLHSTVLTKDGYVDRRNREDEYIRREFENHHSISSRIDFNVSLLRTDVEQLKTGIAQLELHIGQGGAAAVFLRSDIERLQKDVDDVQTEIEQLQTDVCGCRIEISKLHATVSQIRTDFMTLQHETTRHFSTVFNRFSMMESRMKHMERVRFNSLAHTIHAPITPVPMVEEDGSLRWPEYFPRTVWRFWCLKKRSRLHRLAELAEFYQLEGYQYWGRMQHAHDDFVPSDSDSSDSDSPPNLTRSEAARLYPEACHQALAATLGLVYYKIRNEVGEGPNLHLPPRPPKRPQEEVASSTSSSKQKPVKMARRPNNVSPTTLHRLVTGQPPETKSQVSEEMDKLGWNTHASEISDETVSKLRGIVTDEISALLRALERGRVKLKPSRSERGNMSPTGSRHSVPNGHNQTDAAQEDEVRTIPNTVSTELISPVAGKDDPLPDTVSDASSPAT
ncbi:hypothetical protein VTN00DRAFT_3836 [Thermoascus crustaceus]|uniref:uncharacterized protein n=1 Tax=Thermoascus crustaceus TaxID=5088 RepID=UPI0037444CBD